MAFHVTDVHETRPLLMAVVINSCSDRHQDRTRHADSMGVNACTPLSTAATEPIFMKLALDGKLS